MAVDATRLCSRTYGRRVTHCSPYEKPEPDEGKASMLGSMMLTHAKRNNRHVGLIVVDINIAGQRKSALVDMRISNLFISEKATVKLGLSIKKLNKKIKTVNFEDVPTVGVA
ncbi:hypothetical protein J1N35_022783 [Gossypium stocksii]|uniref:Uncharacterized protein n=1 Tax=Gossypium stocksii TaxID=47602 RepID=A0A9D3VIJ9_9ROSI|nr:hypothetical protein J1N35_022783 [Gossypium stocksii]